MFIFDAFQLSRLAAQFRTGLGDADNSLTCASPAQLHAYYPYMREGDSLKVVSSSRQDFLMRQLMELALMNKIMWSGELLSLLLVASSLRGGNVEG